MPELLGTSQVLKFIERKTLGQSACLGLLDPSLILLQMGLADVEIVAQFIRWLDVELKETSQVVLPCEPPSVQPALTLPLMN